MEDTPEHQATRMELAQERSARHEDLMMVVQGIASKLDTHINRETPVIEAARRLLDEHGEPDETRARIMFVNEWMERAKDRRALRKAIIEKTTIGAIWAILVYVAYAVGHDMKDILKAWIVK